jgi:hypothetical protein
MTDKNTIDQPRSQLLLDLDFDPTEPDSCTCGPERVHGCQCGYEDRMSRG